MGTFIQYTAFPGIVRRGVTKEDFKSLGIDHEDVWFETNRPQVDASEFPEEVLEVFRNDPDFKVKESDDAPRFPKSMTGENYQEETRSSSTVSTADGNEGSVSGAVGGGGTGGGRATRGSSTGGGTGTTGSGSTSGGST